MELLVIADALRRASATRITAVVALLRLHARQGPQARGPACHITAKLVANLMTTAEASTACSPSISMPSRSRAFLRRAPGRPSEWRCPSSSRYLEGDSSSRIRWWSAPSTGSIKTADRIARKLGRHPRHHRQAPHRETRRPRSPTSSARSARPRRGHRRRHDHHRRLDHQRRAHRAAVRRQARVPGGHPRRAVVRRGLRAPDRGQARRATSTDSIPSRRRYAELPIEVLTPSPPARRRHPPHPHQPVRQLAGRLEAHVHRSLHMSTAATHSYPPPSPAPKPGARPPGKRCACLGRCRSP